jgi:hypothetical protein
VEEREGFGSETNHDCFERIAVAYDDFAVGNPGRHETERVRPEFKPASGAGESADALPGKKDFEVGMKMARMHGIEEVESSGHVDLEMRKSNL